MRPKRCRKKYDAESLVETIFSKKFQYIKPQATASSNEKQWELPPPAELFQEYYQFEQLQKEKQILNACKSKLNNYNIDEWGAHTKRTNPADNITWTLKHKTEAEFVTIPWCKLYECLHTYPLVKSRKLNSLHLCEAPGAFITSLNHYMQSKLTETERDTGAIQWRWLATTLNPYYEGNPIGEMLLDERFMLYTLENWYFHKDFTGNIINVEHIEQLAAKCDEHFNKEGLQFITADGSIDCMFSPGEQEEVIDNLHFAEILTALTLLDEDGSFVVKLFTLFEANSVCKMYLLNCVFKEVHVFKPATSKPGNSECYVICLGYLKNSKHLPETLNIMKQQLGKCQTKLLPLFAKRHLPEDFLEQHFRCQIQFDSYQMMAIEDNIATFKIGARGTKSNIHNLRLKVCNEFYRRFSVQPILEEQKVLYGRSVNIANTACTFFYKGSHAERELQKDLSRDEKIFQLLKQLNEIEKRLEYDNESLGLVLNDKPSEQEAKQLKLYHGKLYKHLHSSVFVSLELLMLRNKVLDVCQIDAVSSKDGCVSFDEAEDSLEWCQSSSDYCKTEHSNLQKLLEKLQKNQAPRIVFKQLPFLTHLLVSFLYYMFMNFYERIEFHLEPELSITLEKRCKIENAERNEKLQRLHAILTTEAGILCLVDLKLLHRNAFHDAVQCHNNHLLIRNLYNVLKYQPMGSSS